MDPGAVAVTALSLLLGLWYGAGYLYNRRRGELLFHWLQRGVEALGGEIEAGWLGSPAAGVRLNVRQAQPPFQRLELTLLLESREVMPLWLLNRLRDRQDALIIKGTLRLPVSGEVEVLPSKGRLAQSLRREAKHPWTWQEGPHGLALAYRGSGGKKRVAALMGWLEAYGAHLDRFSWRKTDPHVQLQIWLKGLESKPCRPLFTGIQAALMAATHVNRPSPRSGGSRNPRVSRSRGLLAPSLRGRKEVRRGNAEGIISDDHADRPIH